MKFNSLAICLLFSAVLPVAANASGHPVIYTSATVTYTDYVKDRDACMSSARADASSAVNSMGAYTPNAAARIGAAIGEGIVEANKIKAFYDTCMTGKGYSAQPITKQEVLQLQARDIVSVQNHAAENVWNAHVVKSVTENAPAADSSASSASVSSDSSAISH